MKEHSEPSKNYKKVESIDIPGIDESLNSVSEERKRLLIEMMKEDEKNGMYERSDNELIAEFDSHMEWYVPSNSEYEPYWRRIKGEVRYGNFQPRELKYDTSWDWLMPVVEKINNKYQLWCQTKRFKEMDPIYRKLQNELIFCNISEVHVWCIEFIKFYNSQQLEK